MANWYEQWANASIPPTNMSELPAQPSPSAGWFGMSMSSPSMMSELPAYPAWGQGQLLGTPRTYPNVLPGRPFRGNGVGPDGAAMVFNGSGVAPTGAYRPSSQIALTAPQAAGQPPGIPTGMSVQNQPPFRAKPSPAQVVAARRAAAVPPPSMVPSIQLGAAPTGVSVSQALEAGKLGQTSPSMAPTLNVTPWQPPGPVSGAAGRTPVQSAYVSPGAPAAASVVPTGMGAAMAGGASRAVAAGAPPAAAASQDPASMWSWGNPHAWSTVINGLGTAGNLTLGTMAYLQGQEEFAVQKDFANRNFNNQVDTYNSAREDRIRGQFSSDTKEQEDAKVAKGALKKK